MVKLLNWSERLSMLTFQSLIIEVLYSGRYRTILRRKGRVIMRLRNSPFEVLPWDQQHQQHSYLTFKSPLMRYAYWSYPCGPDNMAVAQLLVRLQPRGSYIDTLYRQ